ncbi:hypothetical protein BX616_003312 [Lobosporangium transversale]|uniref:Cyclin-domain-containing protein n=1 Tax=Lobosporangium transversale TaxID=64571 RepID=A0A1Y2GLD6_9FUNG|nr:hypothetical protein BCR41DRAFT_386981 [Lobosporangium transversale]KAF9899067.1 hypothetical protein BX616_003312 [Lobosporangium transversale]ORZ14432.1 hypothetical protein BCR41DRAFT_386981 [Lobosporangium transversale]|eukprot:XP_021880910.1 hypothetical protein BCR41DRAFT_386981 [Lobosporangium transversale]
MDAHAPIAHYQTALPAAHPVPYPSGRATLGIGSLVPISMDSLGPSAQANNSVSHMTSSESTVLSGYSSASYHSLPTTQQHQQLQTQLSFQQQHYVPIQMTIPQSQPQSLQQHTLQLQSLQPLHSIMTPQHNLSHSHSYKQSQLPSSSQPSLVQTAQQQKAQQILHLQQQQQQQIQQQHLQQQIQQQRQIPNLPVVTSLPTHHSHAQIQSYSHHVVAKSQSQQRQQHYQHPHHHQQQQHREHARDHRSNRSNSSALDHVVHLQTSVLQLAEFASVMVYTLWHTRPNINGASSNAYNVVPHRMAIPPSAGPAFKKFCLKVLSATQLSSSVILLSLKYIQKLLKNNPSIHGQQGSEFRLFTVSLMLANKFLDDNTFTNKTWSEVTGINIKEINVMEMEFLNQVQFSLFVSEAEYLDWLHSLETWLKQQGQGSQIAVSN